LLRSYVPLLWPLLGAFAAFALERFSDRIPQARWISGPRPRWVFVLLLAGVVALFSGRRTQAAYPASAFTEMSARIEALPEDCEIWVAPDSMSDAELKAYASWYFEGRPTEMAARELPSRIAVPAGKVYWDPGQHVLWGQGACKP